MPASRTSGFLAGFGVGAAGMLAGGAIVPWLDTGEAWPAAAMRAADWMLANLGLSIPVFALILSLYVHSLLVLRRRLREESPADQVAQAEHLTDTWTNLFFGIGVIWTAIGMRSALIHALGDPSVAAQQGGYAMLQRLVDGGILLALSTTIVGGVGGYLMRVIKTVLVGAPLRRCYAEAGRAQGVRISAQLAAIEDYLQGLACSRRQADGEQAPVG